MLCGVIVMLRPSTCLQSKQCRSRHCLIRYCSHLQGWKTDVFVDVLRAAYPHLRWEEVAASLDYEGFVVPDESANMLLLGAWQRAASAAFPIDVLCGRLWSNTLGQLSFLKCAVGVPPHLVRWDQAARKLVCSPPSRPSHNSSSNMVQPAAPGTALTVKVQLHWCASSSCRT